MGKNVVVGLTSHYFGNHDNSAAILVNGKIKYALSEERITRIKHDRNFPINAIKEGLKVCNLRLSDVNFFASGSPDINIIKILYSYIEGFKYSNIKTIVNWILKRILYSLLFIINKDNENIQNKLKISDLNIDSKKIKYVSHYLAHAETAYRYSGFNECLVVSWDGYGVDDSGVPLCGSVFKAKDGKLKLLEKIPFYVSLPLYYGAATVALGFKLNDGEGKTMGLSVYGKKTDAVKEIKKIFPYFRDGKWVPKENWLEINSVSRNKFFKNTNVYNNFLLLIEKYGKENFAYAVQKNLEEEAKRFIKYLTIKYSQNTVSLAGGIFLNVKFNSILLNKKIVNKIFIYPNPGDGGIAVGSALSVYNSLIKNIKVTSIRDSYLGKKYSDREILKYLKKYKNNLKYKKINNLSKQVAKDIFNGKVVGWFQGKDEWGPRALGNRSVLADPRYLKTKNRINDKLKQRDWFMPFAPAILDEYKNLILKNGYATPFMTLTDKIGNKYAAKMKAAIHIDNTARSQIVTKEANFKYWNVINEFKKISGIGAILNTSFNKHGLPIVHTPVDAIEHLLMKCVDELAIGDYLVINKDE